MITKRQSCSRSSFTEDDFDYDENSPIIKKRSTSRKKSYRKWTKEEDEHLRQSIQSDDGYKDWSRISKYVGNNRTDAQCQHRWERFLDPSITKGPWTDDEDKRVIELVRDYGAKHWSLIAKELRGRVGKQCRERWHNHLNPLINKNPWTNEENLRLFILHQHFGNKWAEIAKYFDGRSDNSIKNHWNSSMKKKFHLEIENLKKQGLDWTALIPLDFSWPKLDEPIAINTNSSSRIPLGTITNRASQIRRKKPSIQAILPSLTVLKKENQIPMMNSTNDNHEHFPNTSLPRISAIYSDPLQSTSASQDIQHLFYQTAASPLKQLPMLSSSATYTPTRGQSQSDNHHHHLLTDYYPPSKSSSLYLSLLSMDTNLFSNDDLFKIKSNENRIVSPTDHSNTSSPCKYHVLNTPERPHLICLTPSPKRDCFNEYLLYSEQTIAENQSSIRPNKYDLSKDLQERLGYTPTYTEVLTGQTRDQRYVTEQARRYLSCSALNNY